MCDSTTPVSVVEGFPCVSSACQSLMKCGNGQVPCCNADCTKCYCDFSVVKYGTPYWCRCLGGVKWNGCADNTSIPPQQLIPRGSGGIFSMADKWLYGNLQWIDTGLGQPPVQQDHNDYIYLLFLPYSGDQKIGDPIKFGDKFRLGMTNRKVYQVGISSVNYWALDGIWFSLDPSKQPYLWFIAYPFDASKQGDCLRQGMGFSLRGAKSDGKIAQIMWKLDLRGSGIRGDGCGDDGFPLVWGVYNNTTGFPDGVMATKTCQSDSDCPSGYTCKSGQCVAPPPPAPTPNKNSQLMVPLIVSGGLLLFLFLVSLRKKRSSSKSPLN
jgi:hypothetical protein